MDLTYLRCLLLPLLMALSVSAWAESSQIYLDADDKAVAQLEQAIELQIAGKWREALDLYLKTAEAFGNKLIAAPPRNLVRQVMAYDRLFKDLAGSGLDVKTLSYKDHQQFLVWKKVGKERLAATMASLRPRLKSVPNLTDDLLRQSAEASLVLTVLREEYGIMPSLAGISERYRRDYATNGVKGLIQGLHRQRVVTPNFGEGRGVTRYLSVATYVGWLLVDLPDEGRRIYQQLYGPLSDRLLASATDRQKEPLVTLADRYLGLPQTAIALDRLAEWALERGDASEAVERWRRLLRSFPQGTKEHPRKAVIARLALAHGLLGEVQAVEELLRSCGEVSRKVPIAGAEISLPGHLKRMCALARERAGGGRRWVRPAGIHFPDAGRLIGSVRYREYFPDDARSGYSSRYPSDYFPMLGPKGRLYIKGYAQVMCLELQTSKLICLSGRFTSLRTRRWSSKARHVLAEGFYGAIGEAGLYTTFPTGTEEIPTSSLVCQDKDTLVERWRRPTSSEQDPQLSGGLVSSLLGLRGRRLYASLTTTTGDIGSYAYCFDARTGKTIWKRFICSRHRGQRPVFPLGAVTIRGPTVYVASNQGVVAALEAATGQVRWLKRYDELPAELRLDGLSGQNRWFLQPPLVIGNRVLYAPPDTPRAILVEAATGEEVWRFPEGENPRLRYMVGVGRRGYLYFGGSGVDAISENPVGQKLGRRLVARSDLSYDLGDSKDQLSEWHFSGWRVTQTDRGILYVSVDRVTQGYRVSLFRRYTRQPAEMLASGTIRTKQGTVLLKPARGKGPALSTRVRVNFKGVAKDIRVRIFGKVYGSPAITRDQVLVPTSDGILRLDRHNGLKVIGLWESSRMEGYEPGNLRVVQQVGREAMLVVSGPSSLKIYRARTNKK